MANLPYAKDELSIKIQILSCHKLLIGDAVSSDPYVIVLLGKKELHRTKYLRKTLNPTFGAKEDNEFDAQFFWGDLSKKGGLTFEVKDWDRIGEDDPLGSVRLSPFKILEMALNETPTTIELEPPAKPSPKMKIKKGAGSITLCMQHTSNRRKNSRFWAPPRSSIASRRSTIKSSDDESLSSDSSSDESFGSQSSAPDYDKVLHIEIVSCKNLLAGDANGLSDPYVKVQMGTRFLHRTSVIKHTLNPAFTAAHKNSFILDCSAEDLWAAGGIELRVKDHDDGIAALGYTNDELGSAKVPPGKLYQASGANMKIKITPPKDSKEFRRGLPAGSIIIRVREATAEDEKEIKDRSNVFKKTKKTKKKQAKKFIPEVDLTGIEKKILLVEVLSCRELLAADKNGFSDPYILAKLGFKDIHKTNYIKKTLNPVFTEKHKNSFVVDCSVSELFGANGILIKVIDWDGSMISADDELGSVQIPATTLYECQEEEYRLDPPPGRNDKAGYITIRITEISEEQSEQFGEEQLASSKTSLSVSASLASVSKAVMPSGLSTSETGFSGSGSNRDIDTLDFEDMPEKILLVEILCCRNLIAADDNGLSDPYVRAKMGKEDLHKTKFVKKTLNPVFTSSQNNSFLITCSKSELARAQGILLKVVDWDRVGGDDDLGWVQIQAQSLYECQLQEYALNAPYGSSEDAGYVTIRATELTEEERAQYEEAMEASLPKSPQYPSTLPTTLDSNRKDILVPGGSSPRTMLDSPGTQFKSIALDDNGVPISEAHVQVMLKPAYDPDAKLIAEEEKKFRMLVAAVGVSLVLLVVILTVPSVTGRIARSGEPELDVEPDVRISRPLDQGIAQGRSDGVCTDLPRWTDSYGYGCEYYTENEDDCKTYAGEVGRDGIGPSVACCVCQKAARSSCVDRTGWIDFYEDSCDWYEENEPIGCPGEGHVSGTDNVIASEACCHCRTIDERADRPHGKGQVEGYEHM